MEENKTNKQLDKINEELIKIKKEIRDRGHGWASFWLFMIWLTLESGFIWVKTR